MNDPNSFDVVSNDITAASWDAYGNVKSESQRDRPAILSGAMWVGETRLIDNIILGNASHLGITS